MAIGPTQRRQLLAAAVALFAAISTALALPISACTWGETSGELSTDTNERLRVIVARASGRPLASELLNFERTYPATRAATLSAVLRAHMALDARDPGLALSAIPNDENLQRTAIGDFAVLLKGRALAAQGQNGQAIRTWTTIPTRYPDSIHSRAAILEAARTAIRAGNAAGGVELLRPLADANDATALAIAAGTATDAGDNQRAAELYRRIYFFAPATPEAAEAASALSAMGIDPLGIAAAEDELRARASGLLGAEKYADAAVAFERLLQSYPAARDRDRLLLYRGMAQGWSRDPVAALATLQLVSAADAETHAQALYEAGAIARRAGNLVGFESYGRQLRSTYPRSPWTAKYLADLIDTLEARKRTAELFVAQRALIDGFPSFPRAAEASYDRAWLAYRARDYARAAELFLEHLTLFRTPTSKWIGEAAFWGGRSYEYLGNRQRALLLYNTARQRYPFGYHGSVAARRADDLVARYPGLVAETPKAGSQLAVAVENALTVQPIVETASEAALLHAARADDFGLIGLWDLALEEIRVAQSITPDSPGISLVHARLLRHKGEPYQATLALRKGYPDVYSYRDDQMPREAWETMFPLSHWQTIREQSAANGLDPYFVAGLIRQESVFNPLAISRANARGLMQVLPSTGRLVAKSQGLGTITAGDLYNPTTNITLGTAYLADQVARFGRLELAAAAYNAGPGRVVQWKAARPVEPIEEWVESIPLNETRGYVMGVIRYAANYRRLYGASAAVR